MDLPDPAEMAALVQADINPALLADMLENSDDPDALVFGVGPSPPGKRKRRGEAALSGTDETKQPDSAAKPAPAQALKELWATMGAEERAAFMREVQT